MTDCVKSQGIYNSLCCTAQAVYSFTGALSAEGTTAPESHCSCVVLWFSNPQQPSARVWDKSPPVHASWICSKSEFVLCSLATKHTSILNYVLWISGCCLMNFFLQQLDLSCGSVGFWVFFLFLPNFIGYGQLRWQFKDLGLKRMIPCSSSFTSSCPTSINWYM